jgi:Asp/Glu/hydantoin racemase
MKELLVLVHTVPPLLPVFTKLVGELLPEARVKHILDEPLLEAVRLRGGLTGMDADRLLTHVQAAEDIGASAVLVTCSTISPLVDQVRSGTGLPVHKIDEAMLDAAARLGPCIGVLATNPTTLEPTRKLLLERAAAGGRTIQVETQLVPGALEALMNGDGDTHDRLLSAAIGESSARVDVVVLAQASMARVLEALPASAQIKPVLSSPHLALERLKPLFLAQ